MDLMAMELVDDRGNRVGADRHRKFRQWGCGPEEGKSREKRRHSEANQKVVRDYFAAYMSLLGIRF